MTQIFCDTKKNFAISEPQNRNFRLISSILAWIRFRIKICSKNGREKLRQNGRENRHEKRALLELRFLNYLKKILNKSYIKLYHFYLIFPLGARPAARLVPEKWLPLPY